jgi:hypothetical protein
VEELKRELKRNSGCQKSCYGRNRRRNGSGYRPLWCWACQVLRLAWLNKSACEDGRYSEITKRVQVDMDPYSKINAWSAMLTAIGTLLLSFTVGQVGRGVVS